MALPPGQALAERIRERAAACGLALDGAWPTALAIHAERVLGANPELHLTTITEPDEFIERHLGEAFEGAAMLAPDASGILLDLGSGNGYPGLPIAAARPGLRAFLSEASVRKAAFLRALVHEIEVAVEVVEGQVQRPGDLEGLPPLRLLVTRAVGAWPKILPRLTPCLEPEGEVLVWAGEEVEAIARREAWRKLCLEEQKALPGRERSWVWRFRRVGAA